MFSINAFEIIMNLHKNYVVMDCYFYKLKIILTKRSGSLYIGHKSIKFFFEVGSHSSFNDFLRNSKQAFQCFSISSKGKLLNSCLRILKCPSSSCVDNLFSDISLFGLIFLLTWLFQFLYLLYNFPSGAALRRLTW